MPLILAIETTTRLCSIALGRDGTLLAQREAEDERHTHAEKLNVYIEEVMHEAGLPISAIDAVAVGLGPGSYTGSRIGLSAAKGLCYALDKPIIGMSTLTTLVHSARSIPGMHDAICWPMIDARRMEVFTQRHSALGEPSGEMHPLILDEAWARNAGACLVFGDGADKALELWRDHLAITHVPGIRPHARAMLFGAGLRLRDGIVDDIAYLVPLYGKEAKVTQPGKRAR